MYLYLQSGEDVFLSFIKLNNPVNRNFLVQKYDFLAYQKTLVIVC